MTHSSFRKAKVGALWRCVGLYWGFWGVVNKKGRKPRTLSDITMVAWLVERVQQATRGDSPREQLTDCQELELLLGGVIIPEGGVKLRGCGRIAGFGSLVVVPVE